MQKLLNTLTFYFLQRAYAQMQRTANLQNGDKVAEHLEDYYTIFCSK